MIDIVIVFLVQISFGHLRINNAEKRRYLPQVEEFTSTVFDCIVERFQFIIEMQAIRVWTAGFTRKLGGQVKESAGKL